PLQKQLNTATPELDAASVQWAEALRLPEVRGLPKNRRDVLLIEPGKRNDTQKQAIAAHYRTVAPQLEPVRKKLADLQRQKDDINKEVPTTLISLSVTPRQMRLLPRGNWLDDSGEIV